MSARHRKPPWWASMAAGLARVAPPPGPRLPLSTAEVPAPGESYEVLCPVEVQRLRAMMRHPAHVPNGPGHRPETTTTTGLRAGQRPPTPVEE